MSADERATPDTAANGPEVLVIGYGNTLRQDDGVGVFAAERIAGLNLPGVAVISCAQLSPEHVEAAARARVAVFVDAALGAPSDVRLVAVAPAESSVVLAHALEPPTVLALARDVYHRMPQGWLLELPALRLGFGEDLSPAAERSIEAAVEAFLRAFAPDHLPAARRTDGSH